MAPAVTKQARTKCHACNHPDRERIEAELALAPNTAEVASRWDIPGRCLRRHRQLHMTQEQIKRIRFATPDKVELDIAELTRRGGEDAMIGLKRLNEELIHQTAICDSIGEHATALKYRDLQLKVYREQVRISGMYPGLKQVTKNTLVLNDAGAMMQLLDGILLSSSTVQEARRKLGAQLRSMAEPLAYIEAQAA